MCPPWYSLSPTRLAAVKSALLYIVLVGLPVLGVLGVLRLGERITPPAAIGGEWRVEGGGRTCVVPGGRFRIEQSGEFVHVAIPGRTDVPGRLRGGVLTASGGARDEFSPGCGQGAVRIRARAGTGVAERIEGTAGIPGCAGCPLAPFVAIRVLAGGETTGPASAH